jgi:hypothetical protein
MMAGYLRDFGDSDGVLRAARDEYHALSRALYALAHERSK